MIISAHLQIVGNLNELLPKLNKITDEIFYRFYEYIVFK